MTFLNALLLGGVAALAIPVIIHLLNRSRFRKVEWGAMHLLEQVVRTNRRRIRIEQLILLLVRCAIPVLIAMAMARPVITGWEALAGDAPGSLVVMLDNSHSMEAGSGGRSHFDTAVEETSAILGDLRRGSDASVLLMGSGVEPLLDRPTYDTAGLLQQLGTLTGGYGHADAAGALAHGAATVAAMDHAKRDLIVVSDFQRHHWANLDAPERQRLRELISSGPMPPSLTLMQVGAEVTDNVAVDQVDLSRRVVGVGQSVSVRAQVRNYGTEAYQALRVYCRINGEEQGVSQIELGPAEQSEVLFTVQLDEAGSQVIEVEVDAPDALRADNTYQKAVNVLDRLPVMLVDGDPRSRPLESETAFMEIALQPYAAAGEVRLADLIETEVVAADAFPAADLDGVRVLVLANVPRLNDEALGRVRQFVEQGGGLMVFPGNRIDINWYNDTLVEEIGLLPMQMTRLVRGGESADRLRADAFDDIEAEEDDAAVDPTSIIAQHFDHPALQSFNDRRNGNLADGQVRLWYRLAAHDDAARDDRSRATVLARLESGDPMWVEHGYGDGVVIQSATSADADWNNFPVRPFYVGLMQELATYLATTADPSHNVGVGEPLVAFLPEQMAGERLTLVDPAGGRHAVTVAERPGRALAEFRNTRRPGLYVLYTPEREPIHFVVNAPREESQLRQLDAAEMEQLAAEFDAEVVRTAREYAQLDHHRRHGREIWKAVLLAALAFLFMEMFLQQRFARGKA